MIRSLVRFGQRASFLLAVFRVVSAFCSCSACMYPVRVGNLKMRDADHVPFAPSYSYPLQNHLRATTQGSGFLKCIPVSLSIPLTRRHLLLHCLDLVCLFDEHWSRPKLRLVFSQLNLATSLGRMVPRRRRIAAGKTWLTDRRPTSFNLTTPWLV
ncbi:hypothetical protein C7974DRAFT_8542 [Boeremia exigua]|uniref:uncharacterized protein n=1 Tax=Boeremia exigua TaxID=749465 RepID=UPI001E8E2C88|nr:uncharacterized protein C7974DRAFT_8542 [Boeremia exigua]KAH6643875.1 hypothetical protein C7974DRAFT_8542 [Boeremia exigua]